MAAARPPRWLRILRFGPVRWPLVITANAIQIVLGAPLIAFMVILGAFHMLGELLGLQRFVAVVSWLERNMIHPVGEAILTGCARATDWYEAKAQRYGMK